MENQIIYMKTKIVLGILVIVALTSILATGFLVRGQSRTGVGYMTVYERTVKPEDVRKESKTFYISLPTGATGRVTAFGRDFESTVNPKTDITGDGVVDDADIHILMESYNCQQGQECWEQSVDFEQCYFLTPDGNRIFKDPTRDCKMNQDDADFIQTYYSQSWDINACAFEGSTPNKCWADVNKDRKVNIYDATMVAGAVGSYADAYIRYSNIKQKAADMNGNGKVDIYDAVEIAGDYGSFVKPAVCDATLTNTGGNNYVISVPDCYATEYVAVAYTYTY